MKIIIEHKNTKRVIEGPFNICLSKEDLRRLVMQLENAVHNHTYGWISITGEKQKSLLNNSPLSWDSNEEYELPNWVK